MFVNNRIFFLEKKFLIEEIDATKIELEKVRQTEELIQISKNIESDLIRSNLKLIVKAHLKRSNRVPYQPNRYYDILAWDGDPVELDENDKDPIINMDAMQRSDSDK